jgi:DUF1680 family protein
MSLKEFPMPRGIMLSSICLLPLITAAQEPAIPLPPERGLEEVGPAILKGGFWGPRLEIHRQTTIPHILDELEARHHLRNFDVAARVLETGRAGKPSGSLGTVPEPLAGDPGKTITRAGEASSPEIVGNKAFDSDVHKALEGACHTLRCCHDAALRERVESMLDRILAAQEDDGYLVSCFTAAEPENKWSDLRTEHELYNAGHFFELAASHHRLDQDSRALEAARRFADHINALFGPGKRHDVPGHQEIELALIKLYRATGESRYLDLCRFFVDERGYAHGSDRKPFTPGPFIAPEREPGLTDHEYSRVVWRAKLYWRNGRMQDHKPLLEQAEAVGHAVRATYIFAAMADLARFSQSSEYGAAVRRLWQDVVFRKMYLTGGLGTAQYGDEGFGDPYRLPNKTYCESCAAIGHVLWQHRMGLMEADARYADVMELALYNSAISGLGLAGDTFFYQNPLESRDGAERRSWIGLACCPTNHARLTPQVGDLIYARSSDRLYVNLYAAGEAKVNLEGAPGITIHQDTDYPWDGRVSLTVTPQAPTHFDLRLRIPGWARGATVPGDLYRDVAPYDSKISLSINGDPMPVEPGEDGYVSLKRRWMPNDLVELVLPMPVRRIRSHPRIEANQGRVALMRGPIVYCFEGLDQPGVDLFEVRIPPTAKLAAEFRPGWLHGVTVVKTRGLGPNGDPVDLTAIPYFAWANRGRTPMNLWLPEPPGD